MDIRIFNAMVLAGGRSSRLGGVPKAGLRYDGETLLERSLAAVSGAAAVVVVGPGDLPVPAGVLMARESPPFGGPAAGIGAGIGALADRAAEFTLVLACDMPGAARAVEQLLGEARRRAQTGTEAARASLMIQDADGKLQPLAALYRTDALTGVIEGAKAAGGLQGMSVFGLVASLQVVPVQVYADATRDVDTWNDARSFGIAAPAEVVHPEGDEGNERFGENS